MGQKSSIEWTEATWNPTTGCTKISPGCTHCYAERMAIRLKAMGQARYRNGFELTIQDDVVELPLRWKKPRVIFVNSMSDLFHDGVPDDFIRRCFGVMQEANQHVFQVLTKRPQRAAELADTLPWCDNIWLGTSVENARYTDRVRVLQGVPAAVRFLSVEPLLGPIPELPLDDIHWVIAGGESGPEARRMLPEWVRQVRDQCQGHNVAFFFKQWGAFGADGVRRSKKANGRELDGREWDEMPMPKKPKPREKQLTLELPDLVPPVQAEKSPAAKKHYLWIPGEQPPVLGRHSIAKHTVLRTYLEKYVKILASRPVQEHLKLTLVDGFAGGGVYLHPDTYARLPGSPLIMLQAMTAAEAAANEIRRKQFCLDVEYFFIEKQLSTVDYLRDELGECKEARDRIERVQVLPGCFSDHLVKILDRVEQRGRSRRVIFVLDQYGFTDVRMANLRMIFQRLPKAEVIMTVAVDWLIDHWADTPQFERMLENVGIDFPAPSIASFKQDHPLDWRQMIQFLLAQEFFRKSGATCYTPFFIFSPDAHRAYWLLHFSGHWKARDVMTQLHWELENHFQHFGQPGLGMLGYDPRRDLKNYRKLPFGFDSFAAEETRLALLEELPRRIADFKDGVRFGAFFENVVNETPATKQMLAEEFSRLTREKEVEVHRKDGKRRRNGVQIQDDDIIVRPRQRLLLPSSYE